MEILAGLVSVYIYIGSLNAVFLQADNIGDEKQFF